MPEDVYSQYLGLPDGPRPPKAHVLLGVEPDVNDPEIIEAAVQRRMDQLDQYALSSDRATREQVQRLMNEVAKARVKLVKHAEERAKKAAQAAKAAAVEPTKTPAAPLPVDALKPTPKTSVPPAPAPVAGAQPPIKPKRPAFQFKFTWPRLSAEAWSLLGVAWLMSVVVTATAAYFVASQIEPAPAPATGPLASAPMPEKPDTPDNPEPSPEPKPVNEQPANETTGPTPGPEENPDPKPPPVDEIDLELVDFDALTPREIMNLVMTVRDEGRRQSAYVFARNRLVSKPDKQLQFIAEALAAFNGLEKIDFTARQADYGKVELTLMANPEDASDPNLQIKDLSALHGLRFKSLRLHELDGITDFSALSKMQIDALQIAGCDHFKDLSPLYSNNINQSINLIDVPIRDLKTLRLARLTYLYLQSCDELVSLNGLEGRQIEHLQLTNSTNIKDFSPLKSVRVTKRLDLSGTAISDLSELGNLSITHLVLDRCAALTSLDGLEQLPQLQHVSLKETRMRPQEVTRMVGVLPNVQFQKTHHPSAQPLDIKKWEALAGIKDASLRHANFVRLRDSLNPFSDAQAELIRKELKFLNNTEVELRMWEEDPGETKLRVGTSGRSRGVKDLSPLAGLEASELSLRYLPDLEDFSFLKGATIAHLDLAGCTKFTDVGVLNDVEGLQRLVLSHTSVADLRPLLIKKLDSLSLEHCKNLRSLDGLDMMTIDRLSAVGSSELWHINALQSVRGLSYLNLSETKISQIVPVTTHQNLEHLYLSNCKELRSVSLLSRLTKLKTLVVDGLPEVPEEEFARLKHALPNANVVFTPPDAVAQNNEPEPKDPEPDPLPPLSFDKIKQIKNWQTRAYEFIRLRDSMEPYSRQQAALIRDAMREFNDDRRLNVTVSPNKDGTAYLFKTNYRGREDLARGPVGSIRDISMLKGLSFDSLDLSGCHNLRDFSVLETMSIKSLNLNYCMMVMDFNVINKVKGIESLDISNTNIDDLGELKIDKLDTLALRTCRRLTSLDGLEGKTIRFIQAGENMRITDFDALAQVKGLKWLDLNSTPITSSGPFLGLKLERLDISECRDLAELTRLMNMDSLEKLDVSGTQQFSDSYLRALKSRIKGLEITHTTHPSGR